MAEYVYALHDFLPENDDEVPFRAGERIEVVEKDDLYGDGWWQGRNLAGKVGLFPQSYTAPALPTSGLAGSQISNDLSEPTKSSLEPLNEEPENVTPNTSSPPAIYLNGENTNGHMDDTGNKDMNATMTDVQKAIEQLGRTGTPTEDGTRSFSFASSRDGRDTDHDTDTDFEMSDPDGRDDIEDGQDWHKNARQRLAAKAKKAVEEAEKLEQMMGNMNGQRDFAPPIEVELSDESEGEEEEESFIHSPSFRLRHSNILEEDEDFGNETGIDLKPSLSSVLSSSTATPESFPSTALAKDSDTLSNTDSGTIANTFIGEASNGITSRHTSLPATVTKDVPSPRSSTPEVNEVEAAATLPSPTTSSVGVPRNNLAVSSKHGSTTSTASNRDIAPVSLDPPVTEKRDREKFHPSEWSVEEVVDWLKTKGFGVDVCEKFTEQEITGDVLLELDVNLLKTEIGIVAFGKRMRIANAITDLRRPPSITYSDNPDPSASVATPNSNGKFPPLSPQSYSHSRTQSQSYSHHSFPGTVNHSVYQSATGSSQVAAPENGVLKRNDGTSDSSSAIGLGIDALNEKTHPTLNLSPSDSNLGKSMNTTSSEIPEADEERAALSEGEVTSAHKRRKLFGRSPDTGSTARDSPNSQKEGFTTAPSSPAPHDNDSPKKEKTKDSKDGAVPRHRTKRSVDVGKTSDRLSIFGNTLPSLGKGRKPPPRYSSSGDDLVSEKSSVSGFLPRFNSSTYSRKSSRPSTSDGTRSISTSDAKDLKAKITSPKELKDTKDHTNILRKRTSSYSGSNNAIPPDAGKRMSDASSNLGSLKPGQNIIEQIGEYDHCGWMRKKGERYNAWKNRYFILKGSDLYCLKSDSKHETKIKGYINIIGYKVSVDEHINPGKYNFRIEHENDRTHYFSSDEKSVVRDWMKALMKATIGRDFTRPVISSCNIPTIPLMVAQAMNPAPRPPSPTARAATQKAMRRENTNQLSSRDARVLLGLPSEEEQSKDRTPIDSLFSREIVLDNSSVISGGNDVTPRTVAPPRPSRELRGHDSMSTVVTIVDDSLIEWANEYLPEALRIQDTSGSLCNGLALLRLAEGIKGQPVQPPVPDSAFPRDENDDKLDGLFRLFDFLLDNDVRMGSISINDIRLAKRDKIIQMLKALKSWDDKRKALVNSMSSPGTINAGGWIHAT